MQAQMNAILGNPEMMQQIMSMAQSLNTSASPTPEAKAPEPETASPFPDIDLSMVQRLAGFAGKTKIDNNQQTLLHALTPYLTKERITKLEKAMRAAKIASMASAFLGGGQLFSGR